MSSILHQKFECKNCDFKCCKKGDWTRHISTSKHKILIISNNFDVFSNESTPVLEENLKYKCANCNKLYKSSPGLWYHKKKCTKQSKTETAITANENENELLLFLIKQNEEFKQIMMEQNSKLMEMASSNNNNTVNNINYNNNNTMNNKFNLQIFLNETCKDAMNIQEFIDYVKVQHSDFENFGKMGYVEALTRIFLRNLKELAVHLRPIHCSDLKREVLYVKDNDVWTSDVSREKLIRTIKYIANKNVKQIPGWMDKNPDSKNTQTKLHDKYMRMLCFSMGAKTVEEDQEYYKKIIRNVAKEVCIDKS